MQLDESKTYTAFMARVYEEDYNELEIISLIDELNKIGFSKILCCKHTKSGAKTHYHLLCIGKVFRASALYRLGLRSSWLSDCENRKGAYFYIKEHKGKEEEDKENNHQIEIVYDNINYKNRPNKAKNGSLSDFITSVEEILEERPNISKKGLMHKLMAMNESFLGYYLRHYKFIEEIYGKALFNLPYYGNDESED